MFYFFTLHFLFFNSNILTFLLSFAPHFPHFCMLQYLKINLSCSPITLYLPASPYPPVFHYPGQHLTDFLLFYITFFIFQFQYTDLFIILCPSFSSFLYASVFKNQPLW